MITSPEVIFLFAVEKRDEWKLYCQVLKEDNAYRNELGLSADYGVRSYDG